MMPKTKLAFTLVELLVVIAIISILAGLLLPALENALFSARLVQCGNNQRQMHLATVTYTDDYNQRFPTPFLRDGRGGLDRLNDYVDNSVKAVYNPTPARMVYCAQGLLWAYDYLPDAEVYLDPDWCNNGDTSVDGNYGFYLIHMNEIQWDRLKPKTPDPSGFGYRAPSWNARSCYVLNVQDYGLEPLYSTAISKPRQMGRTPKYGISAVSMCSMRKYGDLNGSAHGKTNMNIAYEDGHIRTVSGLGDWIENAAASGSTQSPLSQGNCYSNANYWYTWWAYSRDVDNE